MLDDLKATSSLEKDAIVQERNLFEVQVRQLQSDKDNIAVNMFELEERLQEVIVDRQVITKEKSSLLSRILFLGEQRSSLMREAEERDKRDVEQVATIAGEQHCMTASTRSSGTRGGRVSILRLSVTPITQL